MTRATPWWNEIGACGRCPTTRSEAGGIRARCGPQSVRKKSGRDRFRPMTVNGPGNALAQVRPCLSSVTGVDQRPPITCVIVPLQRVSQRVCAGQTGCGPLSPHRVHRCSSISATHVASLHTLTYRSGRNLCRLVVWYLSVDPVPHVKELPCHGYCYCADQG